MKDQEYDYFYDDEADAKYCYPGTNVLKNKLDIRDPDTLHMAERDYSSVRQTELIMQGVTGDFSFKHLCSIHKQLFQDIYTWAGKTRTVDISKGTVFCLVQFIEMQSEDLYCKLKKENFLKDITDKAEMSKRLAFYLGELNMIHPFRDYHDIIRTKLDKPSKYKGLALIWSYFFIPEMVLKWAALLQFKTKFISRYPLNQNLRRCSF